MFQSKILFLVYTAWLSMKRAGGGGAEGGDKGLSVTGVTWETSMLGVPS